MKRIDTITALNGRFVDGSKMTGRKATQFSAEWCNGVQEEIANLIEAAGIALDGSENQIKKIFTVLYVLEAKLKSVGLQKAFSGGYSETTIDGEKLKMSASPAETASSGSFEMTRLKLEYSSLPSGGGINKSSVSPAGFEISYTDSSENTYKTELKYDSVNTPLLKATELQGNTATGANSKKLVVDSSLEVGKDGSNLGGNLVVKGNTTLNNRVFFQRANLQSIQELNADFNTIEYDAPGGIPPREGDIVVIRNIASTSINVTIGIDSNSMSMKVPVNTDCAIAIMCTGTYVMDNVTYHSWTPLCNTTVTHTN